MGGIVSNEYTATSTDFDTFTIVSSNDSHASQKIVQNYLLVWVDGNIDKTNLEYQHTLNSFRRIVNDVNIFIQPEQCIQFLNTVKNEKVFIVISGSLGQHLVPTLHTLSQVDPIYIFCGNKTLHEQWANDWDKVEGVYTDIKSLSEALQFATKQCNEDSITISFVPTNETILYGNMNQQEISFIYMQVFKEICFELKPTEESIKKITNYCRKFYNNNTNELEIIKEFQRDYQSKFAIWWFTRECFIYQMLNRALHTFDVETLINMGFFIYDLHKQIQRLHKKQVDHYDGKSFMVYRGQRLSKIDFVKLQQLKNGFLSFNNFFSTNKTQEISLRFIKDVTRKSAMIGILFQMTIDPSISSTPFASITEISEYQTKDEILFSMNTVFQINEIILIDDNNSIYQVNLKLIPDDNPQIQMITNFIRQGIVHETGWKRMGKLLIKLNQLDKAEQLYNVLLEQTTDEKEQAIYNNYLGYINNQQENFEKAIEYFGKTFQIDKSTHLQDDYLLALSYNNLGLVYENMKDYLKALQYYGKSLEIYQKNLSPKDPDLAISYANIGMIYYKMEELSKALSFYEKALIIQQRTLPSDHPILANSYNNIAVVYEEIGDHLNALLYYKQDLEIIEKNLSSNHPSLTTVDDNIGELYYKTRTYPEVFSCYQHALEIQQRLLRPNYFNLKDIRIKISFLEGILFNLNQS